MDGSFLCLHDSLQKGANPLISGHKRSLQEELNTSSQMCPQSFPHCCQQSFRTAPRAPVLTAGDHSSAGSETARLPFWTAQCCGGLWRVTMATDSAANPQACIVPGFTTKSLFPTLSERAKSQHLLQGSSIHAHDFCQGQGDTQPPQGSTSCSVKHCSRGHSWAEAAASSG